MFGFDIINGQTETVKLLLLYVMLFDSHCFTTISSSDSTFFRDTAKLSRRLISYCFWAIFLSLTFVLSVVLTVGNCQVKLNDCDSGSAKVLLLPQLQYWLIYTDTSQFLCPSFVLKFSPLKFMWVGFLPSLPCLCFMRWCLIQSGSLEQVSTWQLMAINVLICWARHKYGLLDIHLTLPGYIWWFGNILGRCK